MDQPFQTTHSCLPVTAILALQLGDASLILSGHGSFLSIAEADSRTLLSCQRVFASSNIHGISCESPLPAHSDRVRTLLVWGGPSICFARLSQRGGWTPREELSVKGLDIGPTTNAGDRILDASFTHDAARSEAQVCVVTAHNELLLLHFGQSQYSLRIHSDIFDVSPSIQRISSGVKPLLYSGRVWSLEKGVYEVLAGSAFGDIWMWSSRPIPNSDRITQPVEIRTGHQGAVFGVDQSDRWLASCSDDRGVRFGLSGGSGANSMVQKWSHKSRVWNVKFVRIPRPEASGDQALVPIGEDEVSKSNAPRGLALVSIGEDAFCKVHQITKEGLIQLVNDHYHSGKNIWSVAEGQLERHQVITGGADGSIISRDISTRLSSGSANTEKSLKSHTRNAASRVDFFRSNFSLLFSTVHINPVVKSAVETKPNSIKQYLFISHSCLLALSDSGYLLEILRDESVPVPTSQINGDRNSIGGDEVPISSTWSVKRKFQSPFMARPVLSNSEDHMVFLGNGDGTLFVCYPAKEETATFVTKLDAPISWLTIAAVRYTSNLYKEYCIVVYSDKRNEARIVWAFIPSAAEVLATAQSSAGPAPHASGKTPNAPFDTKVVTLALPQNFQPTSACVLHHTRAIVLGSRQSSLAIYKPVSDKDDAHYLPVYNIPLHIPNVHGGDSVTSISGIESSGDFLHSRKETFLTTGRNGTYVVHSASLNGNALTCRVLDISTASSISGIEGSYCAKAEEPIQRYSEQDPRVPFWRRQWQLAGSGRANSGDLILYGFKSEKFVVWNESRQSVVFSIDCANAHRPWAYNTYAPTPSITHHGPFAWTQSGSLNVTAVDNPDHAIIQQGGHGREIKALSVSPLPYSDLRHGILSGRLVVTGAEDTTIRFFAVGASTKAYARNKLASIRTVKKHTTGVQHLSFSPCGRFLFSSGGCEELYAWRVRHNVPGVNLGVVLECTFPKESNNSDLRITHFEARDDGPGAFLVSAVYSNSMLKFFRFKAATPDSQASCATLSRSSYMHRCLTQINDYADLGLLTASTDGLLAYWPTHEGSAPAKHPVHQNSIQAMLTVDLPSKANSPRDRLIITGGDDNALGLTLMRTDAYTSPTSHFAAYQSLRLPDAHAAAITAICLQSKSQSTPESTASGMGQVHVRFLSAGNDQHVKLWSVTVSLDKLGRTMASIGGVGMAALDVDLLARTETNVADVGAMELVSELAREGKFVPEGQPAQFDADDDVVRDADGARAYVPKPLAAGGQKTGTARVLVVGVGMEVLQFTL